MSPTPARWLALFWTLLILLACSIPSRDIPGVPIVGIDKFVHFSMFAVFGWLWMSASALPLRKRALTVFLAGLAYAILTELYQGFLPWERTPDPMDVVANTLGLVAALLAFRMRTRAKT